MNILYLICILWNIGLSTALFFLDYTTFSGLKLVDFPFSYRLKLFIGSMLCFVAILIWE